MIKIEAVRCPYCESSSEEHRCDIWTQLRPQNDDDPGRAVFCQSVAVRRHGFDFSRVMEGQTLTLVASLEVVDGFICSRVSDGNPVVLELLGASERGANHIWWMIEGQGITRS